MRWKITTFTYVVLWGSIVTLVLINDRVDAYTSLLRVLPFLLAVIAGLLIVVAIILQTPLNRERKAWQIWQFYDPLTTFLLTYFIVVGVYFGGLASGNSKLYAFGPWVYDALRVGIALGCLERLSG